MSDNDSRLKHLDDLLDSSNYSKQKCSLKSEFFIFFFLNGKREQFNERNAR